MPLASNPAAGGTASTSDCTGVMAEALGFEGMHSLQGYKCDFCGQGCDPEAEELNALDCTFAQCPQEAAVYHQDCLEKYLKSVRLEK